MKQRKQVPIRGLGRFYLERLQEAVEIFLLKRLLFYKRTRDFFEGIFMPFQNALRCFIGIRDEFFDFGIDFRGNFLRVIFIG